MSDEYTELERLAREATPGPWIRSGVRQKINEDCLMVGPDGFLFMAFPIGKSDKDHAGAFSDAGYIAACSPEVVLKLIQKARAEKFFAERHARMTLEILDLRRVQTQLVEALEELIEFEMPNAVHHGGSVSRWLRIEAALTAAKETI